MTIYHFPSPPVSLDRFNEYHDTRPRLRPTTKPKLLEVTSHDRDVRIVGVSPTIHRPISQSRSPSPLCGFSCFPFQITYNPRKPRITANNVPPPSSEKPREEILDISRYEKTKHPRPVQNTSTLTYTLDHAGSEGKRTALAATTKSKRIPARPVYASSCTGYSKSKNRMLPPLITSSPHYEPQEGPVLDITIPPPPSIPAPLPPPVQLEQFRREQQALAAVSRPEQRSKQCSLCSRPKYKNGSEQIMELKETLRRPTTSPETHAPHVPTSMANLKVNPVPSPPQIQVSVERKKICKSIRRYQSSPSISGMVANTEMPTSFPPFPDVDNKTKRFTKSHRASKSWGGSGKDGLDAAMAASRVERYGCQVAPNFATTKAGIDACFSFRAQPDTKRKPAVVECGRRKEGGWSGGWNRGDMDEVVRVLRSLKAE